MPKNRMPLLLLIAGCLVIGAGLFLFPRPASAQCGSSVSPCKNCHEVKGKDPINTKGAWHTQHAFGDFCEFCHAGNVKATDAAGAHTGMTSPLADVKASCQACHAKDYLDRAKKYADALGKPLGTGATPSSNSTGASGTVTTTLTSNTACGPAAPTSGQAIDLNQIYAGTNQAPPANSGNYILIGLIGATLLGLVGLVWHYEKPLPRVVAYAKTILTMPVLSATTPEGVTLSVPAEIARHPEFGALERMLAASDPATVRAVTQLLSDRENAPKILQALAHLDLKTLAALGESDQNALATLLALAKEMKA